MLVPLEIVSFIVGQLAITDAKALLYAITSGRRRSKHDRPCFLSSGILLSSIDNRLDQKVYLSQDFSNTKQLIQCVSRTGAALVGPRALAYFTADRTFESTWDFFIQWSPVEILDVVIALERSGVVWETPRQRAERMYRSCSGCRERLTSSEDLDWNLSKSAGVSGPDPIRYSLSALRIFAYCRRGLPSGINAFLSGGSKDGRATVQLLVQTLPDRHASAITAPLIFTCGVSMSHLQCLVSGFAAVRMYRSSMAGEATFLWDNGQERIKSVYQALMSEGRSASHPLRSHHEIQSLQDSESLVINLARFSEIDIEVAESPYSILKKSIWYEYCNATAYVENIVDYASARRVLPFIQHVYGNHLDKNRKSMVGVCNHGCDTAMARMVLEDSYGVFLTNEN